MEVQGNKMSPSQVSSHQPVCMLVLVFLLLVGVADFCGLLCVDLVAHGVCFVGYVAVFWMESSAEETRV